jgi:lysophospholipid acyltransferase (LPLAT)-like uncharacterized protein
MGTKKKKRKKRMPSSLIKLGGLLAAKGINSWMSTLDYRVACYDQAADPIHGIGGPRIYIFWHENILIPLYLRGHCHLAMLLSQHGDAEILSRVAYHMGFDCVRGSTYHGGARAIWEMLDRSKRQHLTLTPDGPRGPRRQMAQGPIFLASRLQMPLVAVGIGSDRPWRANSWDRFCMPRPFSRARLIIGPPMMLPPDLDRAGIERCRERTERLLNCLTQDAEAWAESGTRKAGETVMAPGHAPAPVATAVARQAAVITERPARAA